MSLCVYAVWTLDTAPSSVSRRAEAHTNSLFVLAVMRIPYTLAAALPLLSLARGFEVPISHTQDAKQVCSGMWGGQNTYINRALPPTRVRPGRC